MLHRRFPRLSTCNGSSNRSKKNARRQRPLQSPCKRMRRPSRTPARPPTATPSTSPWFPSCSGLVRKRGLGPPLPCGNTLVSGLSSKQLGVWPKLPASLAYLRPLHLTKREDESVDLGSFDRNRELRLGYPHVCGEPAGKTAVFDHNVHYSVAS